MAPIMNHLTKDPLTVEFVSLTGCLYLTHDKSHHVSTFSKLYFH